MSILKKVILVGPFSNPAPQFRYENLRGSWDESLTIGEWTRKVDQGSKRLPVGGEQKRRPPDLNHTQIIEKVASASHGLKNIFCVTV